MNPWEIILNLLGWAVLIIVVLFLAIIVFGVGAALVQRWSNRKVQTVTRVPRRKPKFKKQHKPDPYIYPDRETDDESGYGRDGL